MDYPNATVGRLLTYVSTVAAPMADLVRPQPGSPYRLGPVPEFLASAEALGRMLGMRAVQDGPQITEGALADG